MQARRSAASPVSSSDNSRAVASFMENHLPPRNPEPSRTPPQMHADDFASGGLPSTAAAIARRDARSHAALLTPYPVGPIQIPVRFSIAACIANDPIRLKKSSLQSLPSQRARSRNRGGCDAPPPRCAPNTPGSARACIPLALPRGPRTRRNSHRAQIAAHHVPGAGGSTGICPTPHCQPSATNAFLRVLENAHG